MLKQRLDALPAGLHLGTSSFSSPDWRGPFYPRGLEPGRFLSRYAEVFRTVEIDATWHQTPARAIAEAWARKVPDGFTFSLKVPREITHRRYLEDCAEPWTTFLQALEPLGDKRGPLLFQFPYIARTKDPEEFRTGKDFLRRWRRFLPLLPEGGRYAVEIRNEAWYGGELLDLLKPRGIALALVCTFTLPGPRRLMERLDPVTAPFGYVRFLGHRRQMDAWIERARREEGKRREFDELVVDRSAETKEWVGVVRDLLDRQSDVYVYFNNHFAGYAPGSVELFVHMWEEAFGPADPGGRPRFRKPLPAPRQPPLL